ncbi:MAG: endolytic transglycosylase MltG [Desulfovibrionaceae bacterium]|jgi:UPF0755 protein|nr:endolytic transglycosylase MltG [Desulfovibrionaceae bacterium]
MRRLFLALGALALAAVFGLGGFVAYEGYHFLHVAPETPGREVLFTVEPGETFVSVARRLHREGVVADADYFRLLGDWERKFGAIQAGEFRLSTGWTPRRVLEELVAGKPILHRLSIREGLTWWQTAGVVESEGFGSSASFARAVHDPELLARYGVPFATAEGFLFPETYLLKRPKDDDARPVVELLLRTFREKTEELWPGGPPPAEELARVVVLASLVEKETAAPEERARIAGVYANRLRRHMLLQCDPTVIYGLGTAFDGNLKRKHLLDAANPYNTYRHPGLPPGPICSPGLESLRAAAAPEQHAFLYFVSRQDGTHAFSKSLSEHNRAVRRFQLHRP